MVAALLFCTVLAANPAETAPGDAATYDVAKTQAGRDPAAHVKLALWCEAHGMKAERMKHLAIAILNDPKNAVARGLLGLVEIQGRWQRPEVVSDELANDQARLAKLVEYRDRRAKTPETADGQWKLAIWCEENGLNEAATAHLVKVVRLDPKREAAWKRLGYKQHAGHWFTPAQLAVVKQERDVQKHADRQWKSQLEKWRGWLGERQRQAQAEAALASVTDPRAVPMVWTVFATGKNAHQKVAAQVLSQIDAPGASRALTILAVLSKSAEVRRVATESLLRRDPREYAGLLVDMVRDPVKYEVRHVNGPNSPGELFIQGKQVDYKRRYAPLPTPEVTPDEQFAGFDDFGLPVVTQTLGALTFGGPGTNSFVTATNRFDPGQMAGVLAGSGFDSATSTKVGHIITGAADNQAAAFSLVLDQLNRTGPRFREPNGARWDYFLQIPIQARIPIGQQAADAALSAEAAEETLKRDVASIEAYNGPIAAMNGRLIGLLSRVAGQDVGEDRDAWQKWYTDLVGYAIQAQVASPEKSTVLEDVPIGYQAQAAPVQIGPGAPTISVVRSHSCFGAGTAVRTIAGLSAIETIRTGDQVLSQDPETGALKFQTVATAYHNPPNSTLRVDFGGEPIVVTGIHRFWNVGKGWKMARELKPGDVVRTLGGTAVVKAVGDDQVQPVFNLELVEGESFLVGKAGMLVHDNSVIRPAMNPFDASSLAAATVSK